VRADQGAVVVGSDLRDEHGALPEPGERDGDVGRAPARVDGRPATAAPVDHVHERFTDNGDHLGSAPVASLTRAYAAVAGVIMGTTL
jgi:hypothetical protein